MQYDSKIIYQEIDNTLSLFPEDFSGIFGFESEIFWFIEDILDESSELTHIIGVTVDGIIVFKETYTSDIFYQIIMEYLNNEGFDFKESLVEIESQKSANTYFEDGSILRIKWRSIEHNEGLAL